MSRFWSKNVHKLTPYTPGEQPQIHDLIKLNTNENPYGPSPKVLEAIALANQNSLRKYPDPNATQLKQAIAQYANLAANQVFVANSSDEVLGHTFRALFVQDAPLLYPDITYSFYPVYCQLFEIDYQHIPLRNDFTIDIDDYIHSDTRNNGGIIFANPNAPTGIGLGLDHIKRLLEHNQHSVVVVDEAYVDFADASAVSLINQYPNLLVIQTLSKSRSLAGLRVGLALGNAELIEGLERVKNSFHPYTLDALALAGASAAFADTAYFEQSRNKVINTRQWTTTQLQELGFEVLPSSANFVFTTHARINAERIVQALRERNILIRYFSAPRINQYIRISIGTDDEMAACMNALNDIVSESLT